MLIIVQLSAKIRLPEDADPSNLGRLLQANFD